MNGSELIAVERQRQIEWEGWTLEYDRIEHGGWELVYAAAAYLLQGSGWVAGQGMTVRSVPNIWPWGNEDWKPAPDDRIRELTKAGALIAAEIDRLTEPSARIDQHPTQEAAEDHESLTRAQTAETELGNAEALRNLAWTQRFEAENQRDAANARLKTAEAALAEAKAALEGIGCLVAPSCRLRGVPSCERCQALARIDQHPTQEAVDVNKEGE